MESRRLRSLVAICVAVVVGSANAATANLGRDVASNCANCHGTDGRSRGGVPSLAGRDKRELIERVRDFREGKRPSTIMRQLAKGYTDAEIEAAAAYFGTEKAP